MKFKLFIILTLLTIVGCKQKSSGPCDYYEYPFEAKIVSIEAFEEGGKLLHHVGMKFNNSSLSEKIQYLEEIRNVEIDSNYVKRNNLRKGYIYKGLVSEIKSGDCTPLFVSFDFHFRD